MVVASLMPWLAGCHSGQEGKPVDMQEGAEAARTPGAFVDASFRERGPGVTLAGPAVAAPKDTEDFAFVLPHLLYQIGDWRDSTNSQPFAVEIGDVTRDGKNDVVLMTLRHGDVPENHSILIYEQDAYGALKSPTVHSYMNGAPKWYQSEGDVALVDVDRDDFLDIVVGFGRRILVMRSTPAGLEEQAYPISDNADFIRAVVSLDLDGDNDQDLVAFHYGKGATAYYNDGAGGFATSENILSFIRYSNDVKVADYSRDGREDLIVLSGSRSVGKLWIVDFGKRGGIGYDAYPLPPGDTYDGVAVGEWSGGDLLDVAISTRKNRPVDILLMKQDEGGKLMQPTTLESWEVPSGMLASDINGDGYVDLFVDHAGWDMGYYLGGPSGLSTERIVNHGRLGGNGFGSRLLALGDITGDGCKDIVRAEPTLGLMIYHAKGCRTGARPTGGVNPPRLRR